MALESGGCNLSLLEELHLDKALKMAIAHGKVVTPKEVIEDGAILIADGRIVAIDKTCVLRIPPDATVLDVHGMVVAPGFIDAHAHGGGGYDFMESTPEQIGAILRWMASTGVTGVLATVATARLEEQVRIVKLLREACERNMPGAAILGIHLEGPYIHQGKRGAQPEQGIRLPSIAEMEELIEISGGTIKLVTLAPELPGALELVRFLHQQKIIASVGHSDATYEQTVAAAEAGVTRATHLFNSMRGLHHRAPGIVGAVLVRDDMYAEIILDGIHLHPAIAQLVLRAKGFERVVLITDATQAAGLGEGVYVRPGNRKITVKDGAARLDSGTLAGSVLTMDKAVSNAVRWLGLPLTKALAMASQVAAESLGLQQSKGVIAPGKDADLVVFKDDVHIWLTMVKGQIIYQRGDKP